MTANLAIPVRKHENMSVVKLRYIFGVRGVRGARGVLDDAHCHQMLNQRHQRNPRSEQRL